MTEFDRWYCADKLILLLQGASALVESISTTKIFDHEWTAHVTPHL